MNILTYNCIKCSNRQTMEIRPNMQETTIELYRAMFDTKLCLSCHCEKQIPKLAEVLIQ